MCYRNLGVILKVTLVRLLLWCQNEYICYWVRVNEDGTQQKNKKCNFRPKNVTLFEGKSLWNDFIATQRLLKSILKHLTIIHTETDAKIVIVPRTLIWGQ